MKNSIRIMLVKCDIQTLSAGISLASGIALVRAAIDNSVFFNFYFQAAILGA